MITEITDSPLLTPGKHVTEWVREARQRARKRWIQCLLLATLIATSFVALEMDNPFLPISILLGLLTCYVIWTQPRTMFFLLLGSVCLLEMFPTNYPDAYLEKVPFFWNVNTIFQVYAHINLKEIPFSLMELLLMLAGLATFLRSIYLSGTKVRLGVLFWPIAIYMAFVTLGWINGIVTGGDFKDSLREVRSQFYFLLAYLMAVNCVRNWRDIRGMWWTMAILIGIKGLLYTLRRYITLAGQPLPDQGVGSHEEAFMFNTFAALLLTFAVCRKEKRLQQVMWLLLPLVTVGNLATNRRAGTASLVIAFPALLLSLFQMFPRRRIAIGAVGIALLVLGAVYYEAFKDKQSLYAQPARAIKSQFAPNDRDASSNDYRLKENACLMATIKLSPVLGYGYGKRMVHAVPMPDIAKIYEFWDLMPHNQILWIWMRVGTVGFFAFWIMYGAVLLEACQIVRHPTRAIQEKSVALFVLLLFFMLVVFGGFDLQFSNYRDMLLAGIWCGAMVAIKDIPYDKGRSTLTSVIRKDKIKSPTKEQSFVAPTVPARPVPRRRVLRGKRRV